ncbi:SC5AB-like protein [Mya arenaria]|uniref:SC5AB-like protein n=1 Tax=Mya arenaria TaxID=6604 RepID=A0ABY7DZK7_MYAAR|nr:SC5AB-like protein [Mya arenaria]
MVATSLHWGDILVILGYFAAVIFVGLWSSCRNRGSIQGYFLAGRSMHWIPIGASLFASNIGSGHFVGLAGSGASNGIGIAAIFILILLGWLFVPVYIASGLRFGGQRIRIYLAGLALLLYVFTKISADLYSGALFMTEAIDMNLYLAVIILLIVAAIFTIGGGLTAVIWTDFAQVIIMVVGAFILMIMSFIEIGGYEETVKRYFEAWPNTTRLNYGDSNYSYWKCGIPPENSMNLIRSADDGSLPWPGIMFGLTISSVWYWCSDQVIVQRALAAKDLSNAKAATIFAGYLKFLPLWLLVSDSGGDDVCSDLIADLRIQLLLHYLHHGHLAPVCVLVMVVISVVWIPIVQNFGELFHYIQAITSFLAPPVCAVYVLAIFWRRTNEPGAFWGLMVGLLVGLIRFAWEYAYSVPPCGDEQDDKRPSIIKDVHYLHFGCILFAICMIVTVVVSLLTKPIEDVHLHRLLFWNRFSTAKREDIEVEEHADKNAKGPHIFGSGGEYEDQPWYNKAGQWICGIEKHEQQEMSPEEKEIFERKQQSIRETKRWKLILNVNAVALMTLAVFLWGFYA